MEFSAKTADVVTLASHCLVIGLFKSPKAPKGPKAPKASKSARASTPAPQLTAAGLRLDHAGEKQISRLLGRGDLDGSVGSVQILYDLPGIKAERVLLLGLGTKGDFNASAARSAARTAATLINQRGISCADLCLLEANYAGADSRRRARNLVEAMHEALYRFDRSQITGKITGQITDKGTGKKNAKLKQVSVLCTLAQRASVVRGLKEGAAIARGVRLARDYANLPGNICTPSFLAVEAKRLAKRLPIVTTILTEAQMQKHKMHSLLSVSRGSREPAKLIIMQYHGGGRTTQPVVLVGKGLTFDAGGISLKPAAAMDEMKYDMCGGASVFGAMQAAAELRLKINLVGIVPSSENMPDGAANKPGDIVTSMAGTTIEILNTDAEGRLILCDALTYAERFKPAAVVDIATLTGACVIALGEHASGLFSDNERLANQLLAAGEASGDRAWRMPVWDEYDKQLNSKFADLANIGGRNAGAVTAACFLKHFTAKYDWAHLDIAGTAWGTGAKKGATGRPVPLLVEFLLNRRP